MSTKIFRTVSGLFHLNCRKRMTELSEKGSVRLSPEQSAAAESKALEVRAQKSGRMLTDGEKNSIIKSITISDFIESDSKGTGRRAILT